MIAAGGKDGMQRPWLWSPAGRDGRLEPECGRRPRRLALASGPQQEMAAPTFPFIPKYKLKANRFQPTFSQRFLL
jgi:hypothetical protein